MINTLDNKNMSGILLNEPEDNQRRNLLSANMNLRASQNSALSKDSFMSGSQKSVGHAPVVPEEKINLGILSNSQISGEHRPTANIPLKKPPMPAKSIDPFRDADRAYGQTAKSRGFEGHDSKFSIGKDNFARVTWTDLAAGGSRKGDTISEKGRPSSRGMNVNPETADFTLLDQDKRLKDQEIVEI